MVEEVVLAAPWSLDKQNSRTQREDGLFTRHCSLLQFIFHSTSRILGGFFDVLARILDLFIRARIQSILYFIGNGFRLFFACHKSGKGDCDGQEEIEALHNSLNVSAHIVGRNFSVGICGVKNDKAGAVTCDDILLTMTKLKFKGTWNEVRGKLKQKYAQLTDDDLLFEEGKEEELLGRLQKCTGEAKEALRQAIASL